MALESLLLCRDPATLRLLRRALDDVGIGVEVCSNADAAIERLARQKFDAVIVDCDDLDGAPKVLKNLQKASSNRRAIALAIINGLTSMRAAFDLGAHFVLDKPISLERASRSMRAALGFMIAEQRRYFRHPVNTVVYLTFGCVKRLPCTATNLSEGGMAVKMTEAIGPNWSVEMTFHLPGLADRLEGKGEFAWSDGKGRVGIRFVHLPADSRRLLDKWLADKVEQAGGTGFFLNGASERNTTRI